MVARAARDIVLLWKSSWTSTTIGRRRLGSMIPTTASLWSGTNGERWEPRTSTVVAGGRHHWPCSSPSSHPRDLFLQRSWFSFIATSSTSTTIFDPWQSPLSANLLKQSSNDGLSPEEIELKECLDEYEQQQRTNTSTLDREVVEALHQAYMTLEYWEEALQVEETKCQLWQTPGTDDYAESIHVQGKLWLRQGQFERSKLCYDDALEYFQQQQQQVEQDSQYYRVQEGHVWISLAGWYYFQYEQQQQSSNNNNNNNNNNHPDSSSLLETSMEYLQKAEILLNANPTFLVKCLDNQGLLCRLWGDFEGALDKYHQALQVVVDDATRRALQLHVADMHVALQEPHRALALYQELLHECQQDPQERYATENMSMGMQGVLWHNIATIHVQMGKYDLAEEEFRQALHWKKEASGGSEDHPELAKTWNALGALYFGILDEKRQAMECFRHVLWIARANSEYEDHATDPDVLAALQTMSDIEEQLQKER